MAKKEPTPEARALAERITRWRSTHGMSKADLARASGYNAASITGWENAESPPGRDAIVAIAGAFGVDVSTFFSQWPIAEAS